MKRTKRYIATYIAARIGKGKREVGRIGRTRKWGRKRQAGKSGEERGSSREVNLIRVIQTAQQNLSQELLGPTPFDGGQVAQKYCRDCKIAKPLTSFHANARHLGGFKNICKDCHKAKYSKKNGYNKPSDLRAKQEAATRRVAWLSEKLLCPKCGRETERRFWPREGGRARGGFRKTCCHHVLIKNRRPVAVLRGKQSPEIAEAYQAWDWWIKFGAPTSWLDAYFASRGDPWNGPRVLPKEREKIRKRLDPEYAVASRMRTQFHKHERKGKINCILRLALKRNTRSEFASDRLGYTVADRLLAEMTTAGEKQPPKLVEARRRKAAAGIALLQDEVQALAASYFPKTLLDDAQRYVHLVVAKNLFHISNMAAPQILGKAPLIASNILDAVARQVLTEISETEPRPIKVPRLKPQRKQIPLGEMTPVQLQTVRADLLARRLEIRRAISKGQLADANAWQREGLARIMIVQRLVLALPYKVAPFVERADAAKLTKIIDREIGNILHHLAGPTISHRELVAARITSKGKPNAKCSS